MAVLHHRHVDHDDRCVRHRTDRQVGHVRLAALDDLANAREIGIVRQCRAERQARIQHLLAVRRAQHQRQAALPQRGGGARIECGELIRLQRARVGDDEQLAAQVADFALDVAGGGARAILHCGGQSCCSCSAERITRNALKASKGSKITRMRPST